VSSVTHVAGRLAAIVAAWVLVRHEELQVQARLRPRPRLFLAGGESAQRAAVPSV